MADTSIDKLSIDIDYSANTANAGLAKLKSALQQLDTVVAPATQNLGAINRKINSFAKATEKLNSANLLRFSTGIKAIANSVQPLTQLGKNNLGNFINQLKKIPELNKTLEPKVIEKFTQKINQLAAAMIPLANNLTKIGSVLSSLPSKLNKVGTQTNKVNGNFSLLSSLSKTLNFGAMIALGRRAGQFLGEFITQSNKYVEDLNLFNVAMGESTEKAKEFIDTVSDKLGLDPANMMRYMGVFQMIANGFGLGADNAYKMSKNLTQLTYDISSFYNIDIDEAAQKVQSAISGELEPVRRLGYALDQATLKQIALNNGIEKSFTDMTQAEKAQLRYIALLTQNVQVQGDMGRTIMSSANAIRVLKQQFQLLGREIGNIFIPALMKIIPVAIAVVRVLSKVAKAIASMLGFQLPDLNWDSVNAGAGAVEDLEEDLDDATGAAKRLKRQLAGFDELNNLTSPTQGGGGGANTDLGAGFELDLPEYDMLAGYTKGIDDMTERITEWLGLTNAIKTGNWDIKEIWQNMHPVIKTILGVLATIAGAKILLKLIKGYETLKTIFSTLFGSKIVSGVAGYLKNSAAAINSFASGTSTLGTTASAVLGPLGSLATILGGIASSILGVVTIQSTWDNLMGKSEKSLMGLNNSMLEAGIGATELALGGALIGSKFGIVGAVIGMVAGAIVALVQSINNYNETAKIAAKLNLFGDYEVTAEEIELISTSMANSFQSTSEEYKNMTENIKSLSKEAYNSVDSLNVLIKSYVNLGKEISGVTTQDLLKSVKNATKKSKELIENSSNDIIEIYKKQWANSTELTSNEQKEIIGIIQSYKSRKSKKFDEIESNLTRILQTAVDERRDLTEQETIDIQNYYNELAKLTNTEINSMNSELSSLVSMLTNKNAKLSEESWKKINQTIAQKAEELTQKIDDEYQQRLKSASTVAQMQYDNVIANNGDLIKAQEEYDKQYQRLVTDANAQRENQMNSMYKVLDRLDTQYNKNVYQQNAELYADISRATTAYERKLAQDKYDAFQKDIMQQVQYRQSYVSTAKATGEQTASALYDGYNSNIKDLKVPNINGYNTGYNAGQQIANGIYDGTKRALSYSSLSLSAAIDFQNWNGNSSNKISSNGYLSIRGFASGGFPQIGQFFMARENGIPELVGQIGNRTAVANNDQIIAGIQQGVYSAMVEAQGSNSGSQNIYIGNRQVYKSFSSGLRTENNRLGKAVVSV